MKKNTEFTTHNEKFEKLQQEYYESNRNEKILSQMYLVAYDCCKNYIRKYCNDKGLRLTDIDEKSEDAAIYVIDKYLKHPDFKIQKLSAYAYFGVLKALFSMAEQEMHETSLEVIQEKYKNANEEY
jgi:hypothetical protein